MKYLKNIKEYAKKAKKPSSGSDTHYSRFFINSVKSFCDMYLVGLLDKGFNIQVFHEKDNIFEISIFSNTKDNFKWNIMKDDIIPFLHVLNENYNIVDIHQKDKPIMFLASNGFSPTSHFLSIEDILDDKVNIDTKWINIHIKKNF